MGKYAFSWWEEIKYDIEFEADSLEHARELMEEAKEELDWENLPEATQRFRKGNEEWDTDSLTEITEGDN